MHITKNNKVIVGAISEKADHPRRSCIITMNTKGEREAIYEYDKNNKSIFNLPRKIKTTRNGKICVLNDLQDIDGEGQIVVYNPDGNIIHVYTGHKENNSSGKKFKPTDFIITPLDNIIVTDSTIFHILNSVGHFLTRYDTTNIGIVCPFSMCFTTEGELFIGSKPEKGSKANLYIVNIISR